MIQDLEGDNEREPEDESWQEVIPGLGTEDANIGDSINEPFATASSQPAAKPPRPDIEHTVNLDSRADSLGKSLKSRAWQQEEKNPVFGESKGLWSIFHIFVFSKQGSSPCRISHVSSDKSLVLSESSATSHNTNQVLAEPPAPSQTNQ
ncbi:hypothetical protein PMIN06_000988 [Paraphaeosphaeria minitans]